MAGVNKQTNPKIRRANQKFEKQNKEVRKNGKPKVKKSKADKPALSKFWIYLLAFLIIGGGLLEIVSLFF